MFHASSVSSELSVSVNITDDAINEAEEGFVILIAPDTDRNNATDTLNLELTQQTAIGVIEDNDRKATQL